MRPEKQPEQARDAASLGAGRAAAASGGAPEKQRLAGRFSHRLHLPAAPPPENPPPPLSSPTCGYPPPPPLQSLPWGRPRLPPPPPPPRLPPSASAVLPHVWLPAAAGGAGVRSVVSAATKPIEPIDHDRIQIGEVLVGDCVDVPGNLAGWTVDLATVHASLRAGPLRFSDRRRLRKHSER